MDRADPPTNDRRGRLLNGLLLLAVVVPSYVVSAANPDPRWRLYAGPVNFSWDTDGNRGHTRDCRTSECDDEDFRRANLDASIGLRFGAERELWGAGRFRLEWGVESSLLFTEYNLSQRELHLLVLDGVLGARLDLGVPALLTRAGGGAVLSDDSRFGPHWFFEAGIELGLGSGAALRMLARWGDYDGPRATDAAVLLVAGGQPHQPDARWHVHTGAGVAVPGAIGGDDLSLKRAPVVELAIFRRLGGSRTRLGLSLDTAAWESEVRTVWINTPGNERTEDITGVALVVDHEVGSTGGVRWRIGGGAKLADWVDSHGGLLHRQDARVQGDAYEPAVFVRVEAVLPVPRPAPLVLGLDQSYWTGIELAEVRVRLGIQISLP